MLFGVQAALRARPSLHLRPWRPRPVLSRLCRADGSLRQGPTGTCMPGDLRGSGGRHRRRGASVARPLPLAVRACVPGFLRERPGGAHGELRAGAASNLPRRTRAVAKLRTVAGSARPNARTDAGGLARLIAHFQIRAASSATEPLETHRARADRTPA